MIIKGHIATWAGSALLAMGMLAGCDAGQQEPGTPATEDETGDNLAMYEPDDTAGEQTGTTTDRPSTATEPGMGGEEPMMGAERTQPQQQPGQEQQPGMGMAAGGSLENMSTDEIVGKSVVSRNGEEIGNVDDVVTDPTSGQKFAVVDVGGFLGVGQKSIVIELAELQMASGEDRIQSDLTREELQTKTEYSPGDYESVPSSEDMTQ